MADGHSAKGDEPRKIVVTHPDHYDAVREAVMALGLGDVLVVSNRWVPEGGQVYVMDAPHYFVGEHGYATGGNVQGRAIGHSADRTAGGSRWVWTTDEQDGAHA